jgi:Skp family chaperone for outer membrane proteins
MMNSPRMISLGIVVLGLAGAGLLALSTRQATGVMMASSTIAGVDVVRVFNEYERQRDLTSQMEQIQGTLDAENTARRQRIEALQTAMSTMQPTDPTFESRREELLRMQIDYKNWVDLKQAQMGREVSRWSGRVYEEIIAAVQQVAQQSGIDVVLYKDEFIPQVDSPEAMREQIRRRKVLYCSSNADLTDKVLIKLNQDYRNQPKQQMIDIRP